MKAIAKTAGIAALSVAMMTAMTVDNAEAARRGRIIGGIAAGVVIGSVIAGAAAANARERVYVRDCSQYRRNARYNEDIGRPARAQYWWDRYAECRDE